MSNLGNFDALVSGLKPEFTNEALAQRVESAAGRLGELIAAQRDNDSTALGYLVGAVPVAPGIGEPSQLRFRLIPNIGAPDINSVVKAGLAISGDSGIETISLRSGGGTEPIFVHKIGGNYPKLTSVEAGATMAAHLDELVSDFLPSNRYIFNITGAIFK